MGGGGHLGDIAQQDNILLVSVELVVGDDRTDGFTARGVVLLNVGVQVQPALDDLRGVLEILAQRVLGHIQHFDRDVLAEVRPVNQELQATPR